MVQKIVKVLWVHAFASDPQETASARHTSLQKDLRASGIKITILACKKSHLNPQRPKHLFNDHNSDFVWLPGISASRSWILRLANITFFFLLLLFYRKKVVRDFDIVVGSTPDPVAALGAFLLAKRLGKPFVLEVRDVWPETLVKLHGIKTWNPYVLLLFRIEKILFRNSEIILTVLPEIAQHMKSLSSNSKIIYVPNYVPLDELHKLATERTFSPSTEIIYSGSITVANDIDTLLGAARILDKRGTADRIKFSIFGDSKMLPHLKATYADLGNVKFYKRISREALYKKLVQSDAGVICFKKSNLYRHGIGANKISDYLAVGLPVILGHDYSHPIDDYLAGITVPAEDPIALADAIENFSKMDHRGRQRLRKNATKLSRQIFSFAAFREELVKSLVTLKQASEFND